MHLRFKARKFEISEQAALKKTIYRFILSGLAYWFLLIPTLIFLPFLLILVLSKSPDSSSTFAAHLTVIFTIMTWLLGGAVAFLWGLENIVYAKLIRQVVLKQPYIPLYKDKRSAKDRLILKRHPLNIGPNTQKRADAELWFHKEYHNHYIYTIHYPPPGTQDVSSGGADVFSHQPKVQAYKALLFADQRLEFLFYASDFDNDAILQQAIQLFQKEAFLEGCKLLQETLDHNRPDPFKILAIVFAYTQVGKTTKAKQILRDITMIPDFGSQIHLWAWTALRRMGEHINERTAQRVLGVVLEIPGQRAIEALAAYLDGKVNYISQDDKIINWESTQGKICNLAKDVVQVAQKVVGDFSMERTRLPIQKDHIRISLLTCGGIRVQEESMENITSKQSTLFSVFTAGNTLLSALKELSQEC